MSTISLHAPAVRSHAPVRLTTRGKVVLLVVALVAMFALAVAMGSTTAATSDAGVAVETTEVTVQPGETLWQIAGAANPDGDQRETVDQIMKLNALESASGLQIGHKLAVPVYSE
ncbi:LysM peptidoglycan-binding domain-containing protein [Aeromicrobium massiliense]|uniref:LysM peptidoglycan-binding domain-containing protein n=1 Tax=Aeromicrobium massiliense TaxID=1464554 RepID=UPI0002DF15F6|nr:LysM domain-containing protein [Aeromicrobium massiliense]